MMKSACFLVAVNGARAIVVRRETAARAPWDLPDDAVDPYSSFILLHDANHTNGDVVQQPQRSIDFFGTHMCHPGYAPPACSSRLPVANSWYTADCPNLQNPQGNTLDINVPAVNLGGMQQCPYPIPAGSMSPCAYLCYAAAQYGTAVVPTSIWRAAQKAEGDWANSAAAQGATSDRPEEHWEGFQNYAGVPVNLGSIIEVGSGPWTQTKGLLLKRPDATVSEFTIFEPSANWYMANVATCSYKTGQLEVSYPTPQKQYHNFPLHIIGQKGESLLSHEKQYDTLIVMNVIEHVQNGFAFLEGLHRVIKPGGTLIFHERFFDSPIAGDGVLGTYGLHPIRLMKNVFDIFLNNFHPVLVNAQPTSGMVARNVGEKGYYFIGTKK